MDGMAQPWTVRYAAYTADPKGHMPQPCGSIGTPTTGLSMRDQPCLPTYHQSSIHLLHRQRHHLQLTHLIPHRHCPLPTHSHLHTYTGITSNYTGTASKLHITPTLHFNKVIICHNVCSDFHKFCINLQTDTQVVFRVHTYMRLI